MGLTGWAASNSFRRVKGLATRPVVSLRLGPMGDVRRSGGCETMAGNWIGRAAYGGLRLGRARATGDAAGRCSRCSGNGRRIQHAADTADGRQIHGTQAVV